MKAMLLALLVATLPHPRPLPVDSFGHLCVPESTDSRCWEILTIETEDARP